MNVTGRIGRDLRRALGVMMSGVAIAVWLMTSLPVAAVVPPPDQPAQAPTLAPTPTAPDPESEELRALLKAALPPTPTPDASGFSMGGVEDVAVIRLAPAMSASQQPLFAAFTVGMRSFDPLTNHYLTVYRRQGDNWERLATTELECPAYLGQDSVQQVPVEPNHIWLEVQGSAGAHGGCYDLLAFDGKQLKDHISVSSPSPGMGRTEDLNGDGIMEFVFNASDPYVFCYACGVVYVRYEVQRWDGARFVPVELSRVEAAVASAASNMNNEAVALAQAGLWESAQALIVQARASAPQDEIVAWNAILINLTTDDLRAQLQTSAYPLLAHVFLGDYAGALELMRPYPPEQLFNPQTPLVVGTVAEGWETALQDWITRSTNQALRAMPNLAAAYFLRGWATYLAEPDSHQAAADVAIAAQLAPEEPLFSASLAYLKKK